jgi:surface protein
MSTRYGQKVGNQRSRQISSFNRIDRSLNPPRLPVTRTKTYTRPADYLTIPTILSSDQKVVLLVFVSNDSSNFLGFTVAGNYNVIWGDGVIENFTSGTAAQHVYDYASISSTITSEGFKQVLVTITPQSGSNLTSLNFQRRHSSANAANNYVQPIRELYVSAPNLTASGSLTIGTLTPTATVYPRILQYANLINTGSLNTFLQLFANCFNLLTIDVGVNVSASLNQTFLNCGSLISVPLFDTSNISNWPNAFQGCGSLTTVPLFNTANATNMQQMFQSCGSLTSVPLFNTANVTNMVSMFQYCYSLTSVPLFNTANVTTMLTMFASCYSLTSVPLFNTIKVNNMQQMFEVCGVLTTVPLFNTANVTNMNSMFYSCGSLTSVPLFDTGKVTNMAQMFTNCGSLTTVPLFNTASLVGALTNMFKGCISLTSVPLFNTSNVTGMINMFQTCYSLTTVPLFDTGKVTSMANMFDGCLTLTSVPSFNMAVVGSTSFMFNACSSLTTVPLFNTANVTTMAGMFNSCTTLTSVPLFNTANVTNMNAMFGSCQLLTSIPALSTVKVTDFTNTFNGCNSLNTIPALVCNTVTNFSSTFLNTYNLATVAMTGMAYSMDFTNCKLSKDALETIFTNVGTASAGATRTLTITNNWGATTPVTLNGTLTAGSTLITMASTTGLSAGMQIIGTNTILTTGRTVVFTDVGDLVTLDNHGLSNGDEVAFSAITSTTGIVINTIYFVVGASTNTFQVAATAGGAALPLTTNGTGTVKYNSTIVSIVTNTSVTMSRPMAGGSLQSLSFRLLQTYRAVLKGYAIA